jgi:hypothetical protein
MDQASRPQSTESRAGSRRWAVRDSVKVECRKGSLGLGPNLASAALELGETEARLLLHAPLPKGQEVEVLFHGVGAGPVKRLGRVLNSVSFGGECLVGVAFDSALNYSDVQRLIRPPRTLR